MELFDAIIPLIITQVNVTEIYWAILSLFSWFCPPFPFTWNKELSLVAQKSEGGLRMSLNLLLISSVVFPA